MAAIRLTRASGWPAIALAFAALLVAAPAAAADACSFQTPTLVGTAGDDTLNGTRGADVIDARGGNDVVRGRAGDDVICGGDGDDTLSGGKGDDVLDGGPGVDRLRGDAGSDTLDGGPGVDSLDGGRGSNVLVDGPGTLSALVDARDRDGIRAWASTRTIDTINNEVVVLTLERHDAIPEAVLDTNAQGEARDKLLRVMHDTLASFALGFYTEIWSYTFIELVPGGFFGTCNHLFLDPGAFGGLSDRDALGVVVHESFHSFDCVNAGPVGALDEGAAIWIYKAFLGIGLDPAETWAEATYGTKLFYRDIQGQPDYPLQVAQNPTQKLLEVYRTLSDVDPSHLPWNSQERLTTCYQRYFEQLDRNVDFFTVWLPSVQLATNAMLADPDCRPI